MRFAHVTTFYPPYAFGGDGIVVRRFARALARRGHDVTVIHDTDTFRVLGGQVAPEERSDGPDPDGVHVVPVRGRPRLLSGLLTHQIGRPVLKSPDVGELLDEGGFDVVHFHNVSMIGGPGILAHGGNAVRLYTAHEHWLVCPTHVLWKNRREPCDERACLRCTLIHRRPPQAYRYTGLMEKQLHNVDVFFAQTEFSRRKHEEFGFTRDMEVMSPFLPDVEGAGEPRDATASEPEPFVLFAGRLERMKGLDDILSVWDDRAPADLVIAGDGPHREALERLASSSSRVRFLGRIPNERVTELMKGASAVLIPSVGYETFGFTAVEAFRAGAPVVARRRGPLPELIRQADGLLFDTADEALAAIRRLLDDPALGRRLSDAGRRAFETTWSEDVVVPRYLARIESLLNDREAGARDRTTV